MAAQGKERILVIGGTGYIGKFIVEASAKSGHPTFVLVRHSSGKAELIDSFMAAGVTVLRGDIYDHESLVRAFKQVDVVISTVARGQIADQTNIIAAIKEAGNIKRYLPSEFGNDVDRVNAVEPVKSSLYGPKAQIRRAVEAKGIPYTFVSCNFFAGYFLRTLAQIGSKGLPVDEVVILGDGNVKVVFASEEDIGTYTIRAVEDPRTLNKSLYLRPPANTVTHNELVALWEKKTGKTFRRVYVPEEELLEKIRGSAAPLNVGLAIGYSAFVKGDHTNFEIMPSFGVEATDLYPDVKYTTVDEYLDRFL